MIHCIFGRPNCVNAFREPTTLSGQIIITLLISSDDGTGLQNALMHIGHPNIQCTLGIIGLNHYFYESVVQIYIFACTYDHEK